MNEWSFGKNWFVKCGDLYPYEEEYGSTFSNESMSSAKISSSNMNSKLARFLKILPDHILVILSH